MNELINTLKGLRKYGGKEINPKEDGREIGPFSLLAYHNCRKVDRITNSIKKVKASNNVAVTVNPLEGFAVSVIDKMEAEALCRCSFNNVGFLKAHKYVNGEITIIEVETANGIIKPLVFPRRDSNVAIYCNTNNITSYVTDGRVRLFNGRLYNVSTNQQAIDKFVELALKNERVTFARVLTQELWQMGEKEDEEEEIIKALNILGYTKYLNFPCMEDGTPYNVVWMEDGKPLAEVAKFHPELGEYIRFSSLSQNGVVAMAGPLGVQTNLGYEILPVKQFKGTKGKLDISATQGAKTYKQSNYKGRSLVVLAEIVLGKQKYPLNALGNILTTRTAFDSYKTDLTVDKANEAGCEYPAHKVFIKAAGEIVRVKGAASFLEMTAKLEDGSVTDNIVVVPPTEFGANGRLETDTDKFEYLCKMRDSDSHLQMVELEYLGKKVSAPALWCDIYEDAAHSSVYSLKAKMQNLFYYGAILAMYQMNGLYDLMEKLHWSLNHTAIAQAMNTAGIEKVAVKELNIDDIL